MPDKEIVGNDNGFGMFWDSHTCPNCSTEVGVGVMSLRAACPCGWWWNDVAKTWSAPA
jgi:hypothetical protein